MKAKCTICKEEFDTDDDLSHVANCNITKLMEPIYKQGLFELIEDDPRSEDPEWSEI